jgi:hypothetical protein
MNKKILVRIISGEHKRVVNSLMERSDADVLRKGTKVLIIKQLLNF